MKIQLIVGLIFSLAGIIVFVLSLQILLDAISSNHWPSTPGTVISTNIEVRNSSGRGGSRYVPIVTYSFHVHSQKYEGNCISFGRLRRERTREEAQTVLDGYPVNSTIMIYYSPSNPQKSVIEPGVKFGAIYKCCFGMVFFLLGVIVCLCPYQKDACDPENDESEGVVVQESACSEDIHNSDNDESEGQTDPKGLFSEKVIAGISYIIVGVAIFISAVFAGEHAYVYGKFSLYAIFFLSAVFTLAGVKVLVYQYCPCPTSVLRQEKPVEKEEDDVKSNH